MRSQASQPVKIAIHPFPASPDINTSEHSLIKSKYLIDLEGRLSFNHEKAIDQGVFINFVGCGLSYSMVVFYFL